jgi:hypothetical protein
LSVPTNSPQLHCGIASHRIASHRIASHAVEVWQLSTAVPSKLGLVGSVTVDDVRWAFRLLFFRHNYAKEKRDLLLVRTVYCGWQSP